MTKEQTEEYIRSLLEERRGYEIHGNEAGLAAVDAELERVGFKATPPAKRATRLTPKQRTEL